MVRARQTSRRSQAKNDDSRQRGTAWARDQAVALRRRRARPRHGSRRRGDAAYRIRPVDHRMAACHGHAAAAERNAMAERVREISGHPAIPRTQSRHEPRRVQDDLLVGVDAPADRPDDRRGIPAAVFVVPVARLDRARNARPALGDFRAWRASRRRRLVDGRFRSRRSRRGFAISAGDASGSCLRHLRGAALDGAALGRRTFSTVLPARVRGGAVGLFILVLAQIYLGALVAGLRAGYALQYLAADRRRAYSGFSAAVFRYSAVAEFFREHADRAIRSSHACLCNLASCASFTPSMRRAR